VGVSPDAEFDNAAFTSAGAELIRNVVLGQLRTPADPTQAAADYAQLDDALAALTALGFPGQLSMHTGRDLGLREGGWDFAITNDWADTEFYRAYDTDPEHNRLRHNMIAPICVHIARAQISIPT